MAGTRRFEVGWGVAYLRNRHAPRRRGIQYTAAYRLTMSVSGILDHPPSRVMTTERITATSDFPADGLSQNRSPHERQRHAGHLPRGRFARPGYVCEFTPTVRAKPTAGP